MGEDEDALIPPEEGLRFFLSYTQEDAKWAAWLADLLERLGNDVFWQGRDSSPDAEIHSEICREIEKADWIIGLISPDWLRSSYCSKEWELAADKGLPIMIRKCNYPRVCIFLDGLSPSREAELRIRGHIPVTSRGKEIRITPDVLSRVHHLIYLIKSKQVSELGARVIVGYLADRAYSGRLMAVEVAEALASTRWYHRDRLYLDDLDCMRRRQTVLGTDQQSRIHQIVFALRQQCDLLQEMDGLRFVLIPPGRFPDGRVNELAFYMGERPITLEQWQSVVGHQALGHGTSLCEPVVSVSANNIERYLREFVRKSGHRVRLPTREEWLFAAGTDPISAVGRDPLEAEPGAGVANAFGLKDMLGIVWQVCRSDSPPHYWRCGGCRGNPRGWPDPVPINVPDVGLEGVGFRVALSVDL